MGSHAASILADYCQNIFMTSPNLHMYRSVGGSAHGVHLVDILNLSTITVEPSYRGHITFCLLIRIFITVIA